MYQDSRSLNIPRGLELTLRQADERDTSFCYELMCHNMKNLFDKNTEDGWSREKFKSGFVSSRITIIEHEGMSVGFYDYELIGDELYCHNIQISQDYQIGIGTKIIRLFEKIAVESKARAIYGKVFSENSRVISWLQRLSYSICKNIENENSFLMRKEVGQLK